jgi:hypothetical protein
MQRKLEYNKLPTAAQNPAFNSRKTLVANEWANLPHAHKVLWEALFQDPTAPWTLDLKEQEFDRKQKAKRGSDAKQETNARLKSSKNHITEKIKSKNSL